MSDLPSPVTSPAQPAPSPLRELLSRLLPPWASRLLQSAGGGGLVVALMLLLGDPARRAGQAVPVTGEPAQPGEARFDLATFKALKAAWELRVKREVLVDLLTLLEQPEPRAQATSHLRLQLDQLEAQTPP